MADLTLKTRRELRSALRTVSLTDNRPEAEAWPAAEAVSQLVEFYSAQWGHLSAFDGDNRWLRSLPTQPYNERAVELRRLYKQLLASGPPHVVADSLGEVLRRTEELAAQIETCLAGGVTPELRLLDQLREHQGMLGDTRDKLLVTEAHIYGPVSPIVMAKPSLRRQVN